MGQPSNQFWNIRNHWTKCLSLPGSVFMWLLGIQIPVLMIAFLSSWFITVLSLTLPWQTQFYSCPVHVARNVATLTWWQSGTPNTFPVGFVCLVAGSPGYSSKEAHTCLSPTGPSTCLLCTSTLPRSCLPCRCTPSFQPCILMDSFSSRKVTLLFLGTLTGRICSFLYHMLH